MGLDTAWRSAPVTWLHCESYRSAFWGCNYRNIKKTSRRVGESPLDNPINVTFNYGLFRPPIPCLSAFNTTFKVVDSGFLDTCTEVHSSCSALLLYIMCPEIYMSHKHEVENAIALWFRKFTSSSSPLFQLWRELSFECPHASFY